MLTVREAMKTGGLSKCRLLAGEAGLDNAIPAWTAWRCRTLSPGAINSRQESKDIMCSYDIIFHVFKQSRREVNTP